MAAQPAERWRAWRRLAGAVVVVAVLATGVTVAARSWFTTRDATDRAAAALHATRADLALARGDVDAATTGLAAAQAALFDELATLSVRQAERDAAQEALDAARRALAESQRQLDASTTDLADRTTRLGALERCLLGVAEALNQASVGDTGGASRTVRAVSDDCADAGVAP
jgi:hypothetical protein